MPKESDQERGDRANRSKTVPGRIAAEEFQSPVERDRADGHLREHQHPDKSGMTVARRHSIVIGGQKVSRQRASGLVNGGRQGVVRLGSTGEELVRLALFDDGPLIDERDANRGRRAGLNARGGFADREPIGTHVALANDAQLLVVFGHVIRTFENAILTADALIVEVLDDPGERVLGVGVDGTAEQAGGFETVMAGRRHML